MIKRITLSSVRKIFPVRSDNSHKNTFGRVLVCAGSYHMSGAVYFSSAAALRSGCGVLYAFVPAFIKNVISAMLPEAIVFPSKGDERFVEEDRSLFLGLVERIKPDLILFGPGMGVEDPTRVFLLGVIESIDLPLVIDADGVNILSLSRSFSMLKGKRSILTPHRGEAYRFFKMENLEELALRISSETDSVVVLKDFNTLVTDGDEIYILDKPNSALAKPASGDVLAGVIAGFWAQKGRSCGFSKKTAFEVSLCGVYVHSLSGEIAGKDKTKYGVIASDILENIPYAIKRVL